MIILGFDLDNNIYPNVSVDVLEPRLLPDGASTLVTVFAANFGRTGWSRRSVHVEPSSESEVTGYAASLLSGGELKATGRFPGGSLLLNRVNKCGAGTLMFAVNATHRSGGSTVQIITTRSVSQSGGCEKGRDHGVRVSGP
jgi:hypothetical protein